MDVNYECNLIVHSIKDEALSLVLKNYRNKIDLMNIVLIKKHMNTAKKWRLAI